MMTWVFRGSLRTWPHPICFLRKNLPVTIYEQLGDAYKGVGGGDLKPLSISPLSYLSVPNACNMGLPRKLLRLKELI